MYFLIKSLLAVTACCWGGGWPGIKVLWEGEKQGCYGGGKAKVHRPYNLIRAFIPKAPLSPLLASGLGGPVLEAAGLIEGIKHSIWGFCLSLRLLLFCNNSLFSAPYLFFPSTLSNDEVTGPG